MLPTVISENLTHPFSYWNQGLQEGMRYNHELYSLYKSYNSNQRLQAYTAGNQLAEQGVSVCITVSQDAYRIWVSLRSLPTEKPAHAFFSSLFPAVNLIQPHYT